MPTACALIYAVVGVTCNLVAHPVRSYIYESMERFHLDPQSIQERVFLKVRLG